MGTGTDREGERRSKRTRERKIGTGMGAGTRWGRERGRGWRPEDEYRIRTGKGAGKQARAVAEMVKGTTMRTGTEMRTESRRADERGRRPRNRCKCDLGHGGDLGGKRKNVNKKTVGSVAANPDYVENSKEARGEAQGTRGSSKNCTGRERSPLSRVIRGFRNMYH